MTHKINYQLLITFLNCRRVLGIPTKIDILASVQRTKTRSVYPDGWEWK